MSTITYKCNLCKREIDKLENVYGLTVFSKCVITEGCRGNLYKVYRDPNNIRESFPPVEAGVKDYFPRKLLYEHKQTVPSKEWKVFHNLSVIPSISVYEDTDFGPSELSQDEYIVKVLDKNSISVTFETAKSGISHCIARTSVPIKPKLVNPNIEPFRVSSDGILILAVPELITKSNNPNITLPFNTAHHTLRIQIEAIRPNQEPVFCFEEITDSISTTAWLGWDRVLVRNRRHYNLKAKNLIDLRVFSDLTTDIPDGTIIRIVGIDYGDGTEDMPFQTIPSRGLFMLLSNPPFEPADKIRDKLIDVGEMINIAQDYFIFYGNELYTNQTNVESTYPNIKEAAGETPIFTIPPTPQITEPELSMAPTQTITPTPSLTPNYTPAVTPTNTITPTLTPTMTATATVTPTPEVTPTVTPNPTLTPTVTPTTSVTPSLGSTLTPTPTMTVTPNVTGTPMVTPTLTPNPTVTPTMSVTPTVTITPTVTPSPSFVSGIFAGEFGPEFE